MLARLDNVRKLSWEEDRLVVNVQPTFTPLLVVRGTRGQS